MSELQALKNKYREEIRPICKQFEFKLKTLIGELLDGKNLSYSQISSRCKSVDSFVSKAERKNYNDPFKEMPDMVGIRVITYYVDVAEEVIKLIREEFEVDEKSSSDKIEEADPDTFGYASVHLVIKLDARRNSLPENIIVKDIHAEIQIRTVLQHAWAAISRKLVYNRTIEIPKLMRRKFFRLSALLEVADLGFIDFRKDIGDINKEYEEKISSNNLDIEINYDSLLQYLKTIDLEEWEDIAIKSGWKEQRTDIIRLSKDLIDRLLTTLNKLNINTINDLNNILDQEKANARDKLTPISKRLEERNFEKPPNFALFVITIFLCLAKPDSSHPEKEWAGVRQEVVGVVTEEIDRLISSNEE